MISLPTWLPQENWDAFIEMREKTIKKPPTDFALMLVLKELYSLRDAGQDPLACLNQSIVNGWCDVYGLKAKKAERQAVSDYTQNQAKLHADSVEARGLTKDELAANARKAREAVYQMKQTRLLQ